jgi:hypothetical protein
MPAALYALRAFKVLAGIALGILALQVALVKAAEPESRPSSAARSPSARVIEGRAIETVICGMPAVNFDLLGQAIMQAKGTNNQMDYWSRLLDWKNQMLTPNPLRSNQYHTATSDGRAILELQSFHYVPAHRFVRLTGSLPSHYARRAAETFTAAHFTVGYLPRAAALTPATQSWPRT